MLVTLWRAGEWVFRENEEKSGKGSKGRGMARRVSRVVGMTAAGILISISD